MAITLYIKAAPGMKFMLEGKPKVRISETAPIAVHASHYYRKAIKDKDLIELSAEEWGDYLAARSAAQTGTVDANAATTDDAAAAAPGAAAAPSAAAPSAVAQTGAAPSASSTKASAASTASAPAN